MNLLASNYGSDEDSDNQEVSEAEAVRLHLTHWNRIP